jgi:hypothetical protein
MRPLSLFFLLLLSTILIALGQSADLPAASYIGIPSLSQSYHRFALLSINCLKLPKACTDTATYSFSKVIDCPHGGSTSDRTAFYTWYDQDYNPLTTTTQAQTDSIDDLKIIPNPFDQIDPESPIPDILHAFIDFRSTQLCPEYPNKDGIVEEGEFFINNVSYGTAKVYALNNPFKLPQDKIPYFKGLFSYRFPPLGFYDQRKRLSWRLIFPPLDVDFFKAYNTLEFIPSGLAQLSQFDKSIDPVFNRMKCVIGDNGPIPAVWEKNTDNGQNYWGFSVGIPQVDYFINSKLPFIVDCTGSFDGEVDIFAWWISQFDADPEEFSLGVRFSNQNSNISGQNTKIRHLQSNNFENDIQNALDAFKSPLIQFTPNHPQYPLHIVDMAVFDDVMEHTLDVSPVYPMARDPNNNNNINNNNMNDILIRFSNFERFFNEKKVTDVLNIASFNVQFERFSDPEQEFNITAIMSQNNIHLDLMGIEFIGQGDKIIQNNPQIDVNYSFICNKTDTVAYGTFVQAKDPIESYPDARFHPLLRFDAHDVVLLDNSTNIAKTCLDSKSFLLRINVITNSTIAYNPIPFEEAKYTTMLLSSTPRYVEQDQTEHFARRTFQFSVSNVLNKHHQVPLGITQGGNFIMNNFNQPDNNGLTSFSFLKLNIEPQHFQPSQPASSFRLSFIGIGYGFVQTKEYDGVTFLCKINNVNGKGAILSSNLLEFSFDNYNWPTQGNAEIDLRCPGLHIKMYDVKELFHARNAQSSSESYEQHSFPLLVFESGNAPVRYQIYTENSLVKSKKLFFGVVLFLLIITILVICIRFLLKRRKAASQQDQINHDTTYVAIQ